MKIRLFLFVFCCFWGLKGLAQYQSTCNYETAVPSEDGKCLTGDWVLVFEDEFNGTQIDQNKWYTYFGYGDRCHGDEPQVYLDNNVTVNNGILTLLFKEQPGNYGTCGGTTKWRQYSSGMVYSKSTYLYGIFEAEIKIPSGTGYWPAFWLWGTGGEIDIFEFYDDETAPELSTHKWPSDVHHRCTYTHKGVDYSNDYHTYTAYWDPYFVAFYIDGDLKYVHWLWYTILGQSGITCNNLEAFHEYILSKAFPSTQDEEHIIINLAGQVNDNPSPLNRELKVKYVRAWQKKENICVVKTISQFDSEHIKGKSITVDGDIIVNLGENIALTAQNEIVLKPGLHVKRGATLKAEINSNLCSEPTLKSAKVQPEPMINFSQLDSLQNISSTELIENNKDLLLIYPNPVTNQLSIYTGKSGKLAIIDIFGKTLISSSVEIGSNHFDMSRLKNGFYIVRLNTGEKTVIKKIIKQ